MLRNFTKTVYLSIGFIFIALLSSCASTTLITTDPPGAEVYVNEEYLGHSPVTYEDKKIVFSDNVVRIKKEGYKEMTNFFSRDEAPNVGAIVGGIFVWPIWLWALEYKPEHHYKLEPANN